MANLGMTVKELAVLCYKQIEKGNGDKHILISDDDEGNGYHTLFYSFTTKEDVGEDGFQNLISEEHDRTHTVDDCVILG